MYSVPNARNEREIRNPNVLIYQLVGVSYELIYHSRLFNIIYIMRTNINQGRIQSLAVMIVMLINNDQTPYLTYYRILGLTVHATSTHCFQLPSPRSPENLSVMKSSRYPVLLESFWQSHSGFHASALPGISAPLLSPKNVADKFYRLPFFCLWMR